ncbi:MAG: HD domain-containing protein [Lachnospiraceae bacterium]|nr:HD domain-containing protein [Lachnospiraceae bacterium]
MYFEFTKGEEEYLKAVNLENDDRLSKYATKNVDAIRFRAPRYDIIRPQFSYDVDCIIHNPLYNRYADKTQVFSFFKNDDLTRRALHVQFVSKIARTIGRALKLNLDLIEAIALGHDMGHTPFGHKGEEYLSKCYQKGSNRYFNHNVHSTKLFRYILGTNISLQTLSGVLSHNGEKVCKEYAPSDLKDFKAFDEILEKCYIENDYHKQLRPNTLEGCVVRISDMIAYAGKDRQDLYRAGLITEEKFKSKRLIGTTNRDIISNLVINIIKNSIDSPSLNMDQEVFADLKDLIEENYRIIYNNSQLNEPYIEVVEPLMKGLYDTFIDDVKNANYESPVFKHYLNDGILGNYYRDKESRRITADANEIVTDFIATMTDDYFIDVCKHLHIDDEKLKKLSYYEYF